jgi:hypothetical protein
MKNKDVLDPSGHLEIWKIFPNGEEELVFDEDNTITSGMGVGLGLLYAGSGAADVTNFQIRYFQIGTKGDTVLDTYSLSTVSLVSALGQVNGGTDYSGTQSPIGLVSQELMNWNGTAKSTVGGAYGDTWFFGLLPDNAIKRVDLNSVTYIIYLDQTTCNIENPINEIGLFMQNPLGNDPARSNIVAYRPFSNITKTDDFSLVFKWTLNF